MLQKSKVIVLHTIKYKDNSLIAYCYTELFGRISILVNNAYSKGKMAGKAVYFQPLALLDLVFYKSDKSELCRVKEISLTINQQSIPFDPVKRSIALFLSEVIYRTAREEESNPYLYNFLENTIHFLDVMHAGTANFHLIFLIQYTRHLGFYPSNSWSSKTPIFDYKNGTFEAQNPQHSFYLNTELSSLLGSILNTPFHLADQIVLNKNQRVQIITCLLDYYRFHLGSTLNFKSLNILSQLFI